MQVNIEFPLPAFTDQHLQQIKAVSPNLSWNEEFRNDSKVKYSVTGNDACDFYKLGFSTALVFFGPYENERLE